MSIIMHGAGPRDADHSSPCVAETPGTVTVSVAASYPEVLPDIPACPPSRAQSTWTFHQHDTIATHVNSAGDPEASRGSQSPSLSAL
jgi:hypothetical protein